MVQQPLVCIKNDDLSYHFHRQKCLAVLIFRKAEKVSKYKVAFFFFEMMSEHLIEDVKMFWKWLAKKKAIHASHQSLPSLPLSVLSHKVVGGE